jgi:biotin carboxylase
MSEVESAQQWFVSVELHTSSSAGSIHGEPIMGPSAEMLHRARSRGLTTAVLVADRSFYGTDLDGLVDRWVVCDTRRPADIRSSAEALPGRLVALTSLVDTFVGPTSVAARELGLPGPTPGTAALARDKSLARAAVAASGIQDIEWSVMNADDPDLDSPLGYPVIVKPVDGAASWDVELVKDQMQARALAARHLARKYPRGVEPQRRLLFEEFVPGPLYSAEGMVDASGAVRVLGWSSRIITDPPYFAELAVTFAREEPFSGADQYAVTLLRALGYDFGPFHLEVILGPQGPRLVELNPRLIGSGAHKCVEEVVGRSAVDLVVDQLLGERWDHDFTPRAGRSATQMYFVPAESGTVSVLPDGSLMMDWNGVVAAASQVKVGDTLSPAVCSSSDYLGWVITRGRDRADSEAVARTVLRAWQQAVSGELTHVS